MPVVFRYVFCVNVGNYENILTKYISSFTKLYEKHLYFTLVMFNWVAEQNQTFEIEFKITKLLLIQFHRLLMEWKWSKLYFSLSMILQEI